MIATKFLNRDSQHSEERGQKRITRALEASLRRLKVDHVDLYQQHRPDPETPLEDTLRPWTDWYERERYGKSAVRTSRASRSTRPEGPATDAGSSPFVSSQSRYNLLEKPGEEGVWRHASATP